MKQRLIRVAVHIQVPSPHQLLALLEVLGVTEDPYQDVDSGDVAARPSPLHLLNDRSDLVKAVGRDGLGQDEEDAVVGNGVVAEVRGEGGAGMEEFEREGGAVQGFHDLGGLRGGEGDGEGGEVGGQLGGVEVHRERGRTGLGAADHISNVTDEVSARERVAAYVGRKRRRRVHLSGDRPASRRGRDYPGGVLGSVMVASGGEWRSEG